MIFKQDLIVNFGKDYYRLGNLRFNPKKMELFFHFPFEREIAHYKNLKDNGSSPLDAIDLYWKNYFEEREYSFKNWHNIFKNLQSTGRSLNQIPFQNTTFEDLKANVDRQYTCYQKLKQIVENKRKECI
ncbi:hypothetical protein M902_1258 [Bacteriovorax sp. BAL6_X]|uniref:hypothetical protein n=1 Tax=Bacteriovorax sp. BAL6_X TaxID=1201290 RepID=UPI0003858FE3|nr:hypothetical protein [Bacteriovorax sp. BAL6_X]EPZ52542.1 hypothetical protein M902_1258 [Bacteriovorax sp. BAL6_X]